MSAVGAGVLDGRQSGWHRHWPPAIVLGIGVVLSTLAFFTSQNHYQVQEKEDFDRLAQHYTSAIMGALDNRIDEIRSIGALFAASKFVDQEEFRTFVTDYLARNPGIQEFEWIPRVRAGDRARFEDMARKNGHDGFRIRERTAQGELIPAAPRAEYFPVYYVEPLRENEPARGFDLASNPARLAALDEARDSARITATQRINLVQGESSRFGFLVFQPIYEHGTAPETIEKRRQQHIGFVLAALFVDSIVEAALKGTAGAKQSEFTILDLSAAKGERLLYHRSSASHGVPDRLQEPTATAQETSFTATYSIGGREWALVVQPTPNSFGGSGLEPWGIGLLGLLITAALAWYVISSRNWEEEVACLVEKRMSDLRARELEIADHLEHLRKVDAEGSRELVQTVEEEQEFGAVHREFVSMASHEIRTPLTVIDGAAHRIYRHSDDIAPDELRRQINKIRRSVKRMLVLIESTLCASRLDAGKIDVELQPCDLDGLVKEVCERQQEVAPSHDITVDVAALPTRIIADRGLLDQVFTNLLSNAVKYSPGRRHISVTGWTDGSDVFVAVHDQGVGIPEDEMKNIFERYYRARTSSGIAGTGIGLYLVKHLVELHRGRVDIESVEGEGTTISVLLPKDARTGEPNSVVPRLATVSADRHVH